ncbi:unnamed protein product [Ambrosiozyma monospora]|uniref:Unnamed protein product n=1 Tax=Ambrosiozyma monospora TaxID=43982 RepID=A0ACB5T0B1_AMBMO|nr:unnamed protein product [Ambrosiozyma monospora]
MHFSHLLILPLLILRASALPYLTNEFPDPSQQQTQQQINEDSSSEERDYYDQQQQNHYGELIESPEIHFSTSFQEENMISYDSHQSFKFDVYLTSYKVKGNSNNDNRNKNKSYHKLSRLEIMVKNYKNHQLNNILYQEQVFNLTTNQAGRLFSSLVNENNNENNKQKRSLFSWISPGSGSSKEESTLATRTTTEDSQTLEKRFDYSDGYEDEDDDMIILKPIKITNKLYDYKNDRLNNVRFLESSAIDFGVVAKYSVQLSWFIVEVRHNGKNVVLTNDLRIVDDQFDDLFEDELNQLLFDNGNENSGSNEPTAAGSEQQVDQEQTQQDQELSTLDRIMEKYDWIIIYLLTSIIFVLLLFLMALFMRWYLRRSSGPSSAAATSFIKKRISGENNVFDGVDSDLEKERLIRMFFNQCTS